MSTVRLNPLGMTSANDGFVTSITVVTNGTPTVLTPDANNQVSMSNQAATVLCGPFTKPILIAG
jgi:hypothetical protein